MCTLTHIITHIQVYMYNIRKQIDQINLDKIRLDQRRLTRQVDRKKTQIERDSGIDRYLNIQLQTEIQIKKENDIQIQIDLDRHRRIEMDIERFKYIKMEIDRQIEIDSYREKL